MKILLLCILLMGCAASEDRTTQYFETQRDSTVFIKTESESMTVKRHVSAKIADSVAVADYNRVESARIHKIRDSLCQLPQR